MRSTKEPFNSEASTDLNLHINFTATWKKPQTYRRRKWQAVL